MVCSMKNQKAAKAPQRRNADATRAKILQAALCEFSERGLPAASTDDIAERCGVNKRMIYYYFGSKEGLYLAALESVYENLVALEKEIEIEHLDPPAAIEAIINLKIDYYVANPHFISFLSMENFYKARHLRKSKKLDMFKSPLTEVIARILERGQRSGQFRHDVEPVNDNIQRHKRTVVDIVLSYLQTPDAIRIPPPRRRVERYASLVS